MSVKTVRETANYSYDIDTLYGTGWFVRKRDDMVSLMDTGTDRDSFVMLFESNAYSDERFDEMAEQQTYNNRWSEDS